MADAAPKKGGEEAAPPPAAKPAKGGATKLLALAGIIAVVEGALFFAAMKMFAGPPQVSHGAESHDGHALEGPEPTSHPASIELPLLERFRVANSMEGRTWLYELDLVVQVAATREADLEMLKETRMGSISDAVAGIVRSLEPRVLNEPDLRTLRTQIIRALAEISGDPELVEAVLIPRCVPMRGG